MTKRILATWFCKAVSMAGMVYSLGQILPFAARLVGIETYVNPLAGLLHLAIYFFVWLLAQNIGGEIAAEGEYGEPIGSSKELGAITTRCAGFLILLQSVTGTASYFLYFVLNYFTTSGPPNSTYLRMSIPNIILGAIMMSIGFFLAFGPRIRQAFR